MNLSGVKRVRPLSCLCAALVAGLCGIPARSQAQSFDCGKASTAIERAICADKALGRLDESLAAELKRVLAAAPALRGALLAGERHWVAARDRQCGTGDAPERMPVCLATAYRARIAALQTGTAQQLAATYATATCRKIADRYRVLADAHPGESVLDTLSTTPGSGISVSQTLQSGSATERLSLAERARRLEPPFEIPEDLSKKVSNESGPHPGIAKLPNANFYWAGTLEGTLHCYSSTYFVVRGGRAQQVGAPPGFEEEETCGVLRKFGTVDADAVYFEEDALVGPSMTESLGVATWDGDRFPAFCGMTFKHAPQFTREMKNSWDVSCDGTSCEGLRQEAFRLVALAQGDPSAARRQALAALPDAQRTAYAAAEKQVSTAESMKRLRMEIQETGRAIERNQEMYMRGKITRPIFDRNDHKLQLEKRASESELAKLQPDRPQMNPETWAPIARQFQRWHKLEAQQKRKLLSAIAPIFVVAGYAGEKYHETVVKVKGCHVNLTGEHFSTDHDEAAGENGSEGKESKAGKALVAIGSLTNSAHDVNQSSIYIPF